MTQAHRGAPKSLAILEDKLVPRKEKAKRLNVLLFDTFTCFAKEKCHTGPAVNMVQCDIGAEAQQ
jgi:hypothetical protein